MTAPGSVLPAKLFIATLHADEAILEKAIEELSLQYGETDFVSEDFVFDVTDYYEAEMGSGLMRRFVSFKRLIDPSELASIKINSNCVEEKYRTASGRKINLDPGIIDYTKMVLASAKYGGQKIYLRDGIYADMTLVMVKGKWESFSWGFPDFKSGRYDAILNRIRDLYKAQMKPSNRRLDD
jgi:hypothetical protein